MGECMHSRATDCSAECCLECRFLRCEPSIQRLIKWPFSAGTMPLLLKYRFCFPQLLATWTNPHGIGGYKHCVELRGICSRSERACVVQCACICMLILLLCVCVFEWMGVILYPFDCGLVMLCIFPLNSHTGRCSLRWFLGEISKQALLFGDFWSLAYCLEDQ